MAEQPAVPPLFTFGLGIDNRSQETRLPDGAVRSATNFDADTGGGLIVRAGARLVSAGSFHSFVGHSSGQFALVVKDGLLCRMEGSAFTALRSISSPRLSYAELDGYLYYVGTNEQGRVSSDGAVDYWGILTPPVPTCSASSSGGLRAGVVRVTQTAVSPTGFESGAPAPVAVTVVEGGGVNVAVPTGAIFRVYATEPDGSDLRQIGGDWASGSSFSFGVGHRGKPLVSLFAQRPPVGNHILAYRGRLWIAAGNTLWFTSALSQHWVFPARDYFLFGGSITGIGAVDDGIYFGFEDRVEFLSGAAPESMSARVVWQRGAVFGSFNGSPADLFTQQPTGRSCVWLDSEGGLCVGRAGGQVQPIGRDRYLAGRAGSASLAFWQREGLDLLACALANPGASNSAVDAE